MAFFQRTDGSGVLLLAPGDNLAVATAELAEGTERQVGSHRVVLKAKVDVGHKFAVRAIRKGEKVIKYGAPIGVASCDIAPGEYIHIHNLASDYIPTYTFDAGHEFVPESNPRESNVGESNMGKAKTGEPK
jgi:altronate dehydratase small subunit